MDRSCPILCQVFQEVKGVVDSFDAEDAVAVASAQSSMADPDAAAQYAYIDANFRPIPGIIKCLESQNLRMSEALDLVTELQSHLDLVQGAAGAAASSKLKASLSKNVGLQTLFAVRDVAAGVEGATCPIEPKLIGLFRYAAITSIDVERSFSYISISPQRPASVPNG